MLRKATHVSPGRGIPLRSSIVLTSGATDASGEVLMTDATPTTPTTPPTPAPLILDIRVHGVSNSPPAEMLESDPDAIERVDGDALGSFWARKDKASKDGVTATHAFSWGNQTRTGGGALAAIGRAFVHVGWFLLLPYALVNLAYWTREIRYQRDGTTRAWHGDIGSGTVRVFGLVLTLIAVAAFCSVAIDMVAVQCFRGTADESTQVCSALPAVFDGLRGLDIDSRAALLGLVPVVIILVLYSIARRGRVRFEARIETFGTQIGSQADKGRPLLATRGFWAAARSRDTSEWLHVAGSLLLVLFLLAVDAAFPAADCLGAPTTKDIVTCLGPIEWLPMGFAIAAGVGLALVVIGVIVASSTPAAPVANTVKPLRDVVAKHPPDQRNAWKRRFALGCLGYAAIGYLVWLVLTYTPLTDATKVTSQFTGLITAPLVLMSVALFLALYALSWRVRSTWRRRTSAIVLTFGAAALLLSQILSDPAPQWALTGAAVVLVLIHLVISRTSQANPGIAEGESDAGELRFRAWRGQGAAVVMLLSLFVSMALSSLLVLGVASWIGAPPAGETDRIWRTPGEPLPVSEWNVPDAYERFAVLLLLVLGATLVVLILAAIAVLSKLVRFTLPTLKWKGEAPKDEGSAESRGGVKRPGSDYPTALVDPEERVRIRAGARRSSHLLHRGEPLFAWIAVFAAIGFFSLSSTIVFDAARRSLEQVAPGFPAGLRGAATAILVALAVAVVAAVVANAATSGERPLGVFWDVVAFFPRAGHPFAPPCFAERAVPELAEHTRRFLRQSPAEPGTPWSGVILTAHSMGSTISAATILALRGERFVEEPAVGPLLTDRIALLSYGSQLRGYFSRFFPSVFGYQVLGVPGLEGPSLFKPDPWQKQVVAEFPDPAQRGDEAAREHARVAHREVRSGAYKDDSLAVMLGATATAPPRWRNMWRRTDFLGFPVFSYDSDENPVDRGATETAPGYQWTIAKHSAYLGTEQIELARVELVEQLSQPSDRDR